jgi:hypothetical protein
MISEEDVSLRLLCDSKRWSDKSDLIVFKVTPVRLTSCPTLWSHLTNHRSVAFWLNLTEMDVNCDRRADTSYPRHSVRSCNLSVN